MENRSTGGSHSRTATTAPTSSATTASTAPPPPPPTTATTSTSLAPSHYLEDGYAVVLPPATRAVREHNMYRAISQHGLWRPGSDNSETSDKQEQEDNEQEQQEENNHQSKTTTTKMQVHPLRLASTRLQTEGINELNRTINLTKLVATGEYFGLSNIVATREAMASVAAATTATPSAKDNGDGSNNSNNNNNDKSTDQKDTPKVDPTTSKPETASSTQVSTEDDTNNNSSSNNSNENSIKLASTYILKRKHEQFVTAAHVLRRHKQRLMVGLPADQIVLSRLQQLRANAAWRIVAPQHGTRARPHPTRPTETIAIDVNISNNAIHQNSQPQQQPQPQQADVTPGRLARQIPRYATIELRPDYKEAESTHNNHHNQQQQQQHSLETSKNTYAELFALPDPKLGRVHAENYRDTSQTEMLTLKFTLEKVAATNDGISNGGGGTSNTTVSVYMEPVSGVQAKDDIGPNNSASTENDDERVLHQLQSSLLCSTLFESMRRELADDTDEVGQVRTTSQQLFQNVAWMAPTAGIAASTFQAAAPTTVAASAAALGGGGRFATSSDRQPLQVVHVHEGEVCVQLSADYTLQVQLVPAATVAGATAVPQPVPPPATTTTAAAKTFSNPKEHAQLSLLCKTLLWHAQSLYHEHFVKSPHFGAATSAADTDTETKPSPHILQSCVHLGTKLLLEPRIRQCFRELQQHQKTKPGGPPLDITCMPNSLLSPAMHWTLVCGPHWQADVVLQGGPRVSVTWWHQTATPTEEDYHRKVDFVTLGPFYIFLQHQLGRL